MIGRLSGVLIEKQAPDLLIDVNGVGTHTVYIYRTRGQ
jgi:Holliday junction resolvasome RuvABC DNA-binding subunit